MMPVVFGAVGFGLYLLSRKAGSLNDSFGHHLEPSTGFRSLGMSGEWDVYEFCGSKGSFLVAMFPDPSGGYPRPGRSNVSYMYPDSVEAQVVRAEGPSGQKWSNLDLPSGRRIADLFVYHSSRHPGDFPTVSGYGAVGRTMGGRGPGAGAGLSSGGGGRQVSTPYDWSGPLSSGGFMKWRNPDEDIALPGEGASSDLSEDEEETWSFGDDGKIYDDETGQVWSSKYGWVSPAEPDHYGVNILGMNIPTSKEERMENLESKIEKATAKVSDLEEEAKKDGADLEKLAKKIASLQSQIDRWEEKKDKIEIRMGEDDSSYGDDDVDDSTDEDEDDELDDIFDGDEDVHDEGYGDDDGDDFLEGR